MDIYQHSRPQQAAPSGEANASTAAAPPIPLGRQGLTRARSRTPPQVPRRRARWYPGPMGRALLLPLVLLLGCASSQAPAPAPAPLRATSGPSSRPQPISSPTDRDGDGMPDAVDQCPDQPGSLRDGCPVVDRDGDGISDRYDKCPDVPEVRDGRADGDGCP